MNRLLFRKVLILIVLSGGLLAGATAQNVFVQSTVDRQSFAIGDQTNLRLTVNQPVKVKVDFPKLADSIISKVQIVSAGKLDTVTNKNKPDRITVSRTYVITSFDAGTYTIPQYSFLTAADTLKTQELTLMIQPVQVDTTKAIYDIKQPLTVQYTFWEWLKDNWIVIASVVVIIVVGYFGYRYYKNHKPELPDIVRPAVVLLPHEIALNKLNDLHDRKIWQRGDVKAYHSELSDIIREYLEQRYRVKTHEQTTGEIFIALSRKELTEENRNQLRQMLILADLVKFAKEKPLPAENEQSMVDAVNFVSDTRPIVEQPVKTTEGGTADGLA